MTKQKGWQMHNNSSKTYLEILEYCFEVKQSKNVSISRSQIDHLLSEILKIDKLKLLLNPEIKISFLKKKEFLKKFFLLINNKPVSRILGKREFFSKEYLINKYTLDPRQDTELLVEVVLTLSKKLKKKKNLAILELGSGSGCVLSSIASELKKLRNDFIVIGVDICENANKLARKNLINHRVSSNTKILKSNWFSNINKRFDIIYANPPYVRLQDISDLGAELNYDPKIALNGGKDGLFCYKQISKKLLSFLLPNGYFCTEIGFNQGLEVKKIFESISLNLYGSYNDLGKRERCLVFHKKKKV